MLRAAVILLEDQHLALIRRERAGQVYYLLPGGGVEPGESLTEAARREAEEELGVQVAVGRLVAEVLRAGDRQFYFLAQSLGGAFGTGAGDEMVGPVSPTAGSYQAVWLPVARLLAEPVFPRELCRLIVASAGSGVWPEVVASFRDDGRLAV